MKLDNDNGMPYFTKSALQKSMFEKSKRATTRLASILGALAVLHAASTSAQQSENADKNEAELSTEEVVVTGIRASIQSSIDTKRNASTIVDSIAAEGLSNFPDLSLAEALQRVTGVQLDREDRNRLGQVLIRGLPRTFSLVTFNGQTIAPPQYDNNEGQGTGFSLGMLRSDIISKGNVYKTLTADMNTGGLSGIIDLESVKPLDKKKDRLGGSIDFRYDTLTEDTAPGFGFSGIKLFSDNFGVALAGGYEKLSYGRQLIRVNRYDEVKALNGQPTPINALRRNPVTGAGIIDISRTDPALGYVEGQTYLVPSEIRLGNEGFDGHRFSASSTIQFAPTDNLELTLSGVYGEQEVENFTEFSQMRNRRKTVAIPLSAPLGTPSGNPGEGTQIVQNLLFEDPRRSFDKREFVDRHKTQAIRGHFKWTDDVWTVDGGFNTTKGSLDRPNWAISFVFGGDQLRQVEPGVPLTFDVVTSGDVEDFRRAQISGPRIRDILFPIMDDGAFLRPNRTRNGRFNNGGVDLNGDPRRVNQFDFSTFDRTQYQENSEDSVDLNVEYEVDAGMLSSIKVGVKRREIEAFQTSQESQLLGLQNLGNIDSSIVTAPTLNSYFGGDADSATTSEWFSVDIARFLELAGPCSPQAALDMGYPDAFCTSGEPNRGAPVFAQNGNYKHYFDVDRTINAAYAMGNFYGEIGSVPFSANLGVRYVDISRTSRGIDPDTKAFATSDNPLAYGSHTFDTFLPSGNIKFDLSDDLVLRAAISKSLVTPNPRDFSSVAVVDDTIIANNRTIEERQSPEGDPIDDPKIRVELGDFFLNPFTAINYDISAEWYHRSGSLVSAAIFKKDVTGEPQDLRVCPLDGRNPNNGTPILIDDALADPNNPVPVGPLELISGLGDGGSEECVATTTPQGFDGRLVVQVDDVVITEYSVMGAEISTVQNFDFLPAPWDGFGVNANYTYVDQIEGDIPIVQVSNHSANFIAFYEKGPFAIRGAYNYRSERTRTSASTIFGLNDRVTQPVNRFDARVSYKVNKKLKIQFDAFNITNDRVHVTEGADERLREYQDRGQTYKLSARFTF